MSSYRMLKNPVNDGIWRLLKGNGLTVTTASVVTWHVVCQLDGPNGHEASVATSFLKSFQEHSRVPWVSWSEVLGGSSTCFQRNPNLDQNVTRGKDDTTFLAGNFNLWVGGDHDGGWVFSFVPVKETLGVTSAREVRIHIEAGIGIVVFEDVFGDVVEVVYSWGSFGRGFLILGQFADVEVVEHKQTSNQTYQKR